MKTPQENLQKLLKGKKVLFLENDRGLYNGLDVTEDLLKASNIQYSCIFEVDKKDIEQTKKEILAADAIIFQTRWGTETAKLLHKFLSELTKENKKIVIENYISEPTWYYKPKVVHDVYILSCPLSRRTSFEGWSFYKLSNKPYWDYKNEFNK